MPTLQSNSVITTLAGGTSPVTVVLQAAEFASHLRPTTSSMRRMASIRIAGHTASATV
jgi:hypothetical protein